MTSANHPPDSVRVRLDLAYEGTHFAGWAKQPGQRTVQGELEKSLATLLRLPSISLTVGGRTDAGVHARGQVCNFDLDSSLLEKLSGRHSADGKLLSPRRVNSVLARYEATDISVHQITVVPEQFDARFSAISRRYEYRMLPVGVPRDPLSRKFTVALGDELDVDAMNVISAKLLGLRDFATFCKPREGATTVRELQKFEWHVDAHGAVVGSVKADAFCHSMVRALVGLVSAVGSSRFSVLEALELADAGVRTSSLRVMPPHGLSLEEIVYPDADGYGERANQTRAKRIKTNT